MSKNPNQRINLSLPCSWSELTPRQLRFVFGLISSGMTSEEIKMHCFLKFAGLKVIGRKQNIPSQPAAEEYLVSHKKIYFHISALQIAEFLPVLDFLTKIPEEPVLLPSFCRRRHIDPYLQGVPFEQYIVLDNLFQGYLSTNDESLLSQMLDIVYPKKKNLSSFFPFIFSFLFFNSSLARAKARGTTAVFYWFTALKDYFAREFSEFFRPISQNGESGNLLGGSSTEQSVRQAVDAQIRALTKGDVTKEKEILALDTWRALTELNAQAREYRELEAQMNKHK